MKRSTQRILTTHCGRLPDPSIIDAFREARASGDEAHAAELLRAGVGEMLKAQADCGVDVLGDGEFYKLGFRDAEYYSSRWSGITPVALEPGQPSWFGQFSPEMLDSRFTRFFAFADEHGMFPETGGRRVMPTGTRVTITEPLKYRGQGSIRKELELVRQAFEAAGVDRTEAFYPQLAPGWLGHFVFNAYYSNAEEYWYALAETWRGEYEAVVDAGFILQLDDPALADKFYMFNPPLSIEDYRKDAALRVEATNHALRNIPEDRVRYHVCWGSWHFPHTTDIPFQHIVDLLLKVKAQAYSIEASNVRHMADYRVWEDVKLPEGKILIPGVVGHATSNLVESPEVIADRLVQYAKLVGRENLMAGTDCGLGGRCHPDVAWAKLRALSEGAALATQRLWR
ncbi:MAG: epoxyalkane--coenzyme M transferase [Chloroflexi bacterium]|nr:epoxyalkane--coenzyme M transferase [Chloroflexota bacterium]MBV9898537.1 epoxyalkane--coenzyme M transferase [Chloroflexota bacterium]